MRGWRALALVRHGLSSASEAEQANLDLASLAQVRELTGHEVAAQVQVLLYQGRIDLAQQTLTSLPSPPEALSRRVSLIQARNLLDRGDGEGALEAAMKLLEDERRFLDLPNCSVFMTEEHEIF